MPITVRPLAATDWPSLWRLWHHTDDPEPVARDRFRDLLTDGRWGMFGSVTDAGRLTGYAAVQDHGPHWRTGDHHRVARFHDLYVAEADRRTGAGRALVAAVVEWAATRVRYLEWQAHHARAAPFYERLGYRGDPCPQPDYPHFEIDFRAGGGHPTTPDTASR
ncbi:L-amino acid N-acyltransferase YncA [Stackebrandtia albiflava]|uniref:L-amino acid N-acyltransferase YncA n=1 Tax=Stackebrandtia albiflava TaxID=406432 RepID=A0A562V579_9ACTN|nr:GNAT family N-acetyltransferase [Stackebrandtia albiflava]TWJ13046.1 L-amino acid N-acyltransferase YncA [Stackebrandtia albiflava]